LQHQADNRDKVQANEDGLKALIVLGHPLSPVGLGESALYQLASAQQCEGPLHRAVLDHLQLHPVDLRRLGGFLPHVTQAQKASSTDWPGGLLDCSSRSAT
jgi:hypothetical protein